MLEESYLYDQMNFTPKMIPFSGVIENSGGLTEFINCSLGEVKAFD